MRFIYFVFICAIFGIEIGFSTTPDFIKQIHAVRLTETFRIDGILSESIYKQPGVTAFYQQEPNQGEPVSEPTEVWVAYDDAAIYIGAYLKDSHPDSIIARLSRRDNDAGGDRFAVGIDSYHDKRNGYFFIVSASGTLLDGTLYNDDWTDDSWNGVWEGQQRMLPDGWSVEMRIPFSQLRFEEKEQYVWGIAFQRVIARKKEESFTAYTPRNESGFVSRFAELNGIEHISPPSRFEATPYMSGRAEYLQHKLGDPFNDGSKYKPDFGVDLKLGLGSNLTLDGTINPDFGQVEVDPAVVNLSDVETYYNEKRPFFIEGMNIFSFGRGGVNSFWGFNWSNPNIFYSRRIGRAPQRGLPDNDFSDVPVGTRILGAAKLSGKVSNGWNIGVIEAITNREYATIEYLGTRKEWEVEPLTSYTIGRIQRDFNDGRQGIGLLATTTHRFFKDDGLKSTVNSDAIIGGLDGWTALDSDKEFMISGWTVFSSVTGTKERLLDLQQGWPHYFERPDASHISVDSSATSMKGFAGRYTFNRQKGRLMLNAALGFVSPGFESGDLGFVSRTDVINYHLATGYKWNDPTEYYRFINVYASYFQTLDFGGNTLWRGIWTRANYQFTNYHTFGMFYDYGFESLNNRRTRGGPLTLNLPCHEWGFEYYTDYRNAYIGEAYMYAFNGKNEYSYNVNLLFTMRPMSNLSVTIGPGYSWALDDGQWVDIFDDMYSTATYGKRYVFANLNYRELSAQIRVNWTLSPTLSFQMFIQPLLSSGDYSKFKELSKPRSYDFNVYGQNGSTYIDSITSSGDHKVIVDPDGSGPATEIQFDHPSFSKVEFRANAVLRWEYLPGSTLYVVWTQSRSDSEGMADFGIRRSFNRLSYSKPDNIFMLKFSYWLGS